MYRLREHSFENSPECAPTDWLSDLEAPYFTVLDLYQTDKECALLEI